MKMKFHSLIDIMMMYDKLHEDGPSKPDELELYSKPDENEHKPDELKNIISDELPKSPARKLIIIISLVMIVLFLSIFLPLYLKKAVHCPQQAHRSQQAHRPQ
jgi:hypothetical protein